MFFIQTYGDRTTNRLRLWLSYLNNNYHILSHHLEYRQVVVVVVVLFTRRERDQKVTAKLKNVINMFSWKKIRRFIQGSRIVTVIFQKCYSANTLVLHKNTSQMLQTTFTREQNPEGSLGIAFNISKIAFDVNRNLYIRIASYCKKFKKSCKKHPAILL